MGLLAFLQRYKRNGSLSEGIATEEAGEQGTGSTGSRSATSSDPLLDTVQAFKMDTEVTVKDKWGANESCSMRNYLNFLQGSGSQGQEKATEIKLIINECKGEGEEGNLSLNEKQKKQLSQALGKNRNIVFQALKRFCCFSCCRPGPTRGEKILKQLQKPQLL